MAKRCMAHSDTCLDDSEDSMEGVKAEFFAKLQVTVGSAARSDVFIIMGDLKAIQFH